MAGEALHPRVCRSRNACLAGVCAGIAERYDFDSVVIRILAVLIALTTLGLAVPVYLFLWMSLPREFDTPAVYDVMPERAESSAFGNLDCMRAMGGGPDRSPAGLSIVGRLGVAVAIMLLFMAVAVNVSPLVSGASWWQFWPLILLMGGLCLIVIPIGGQRQAAWHAAGIAITSFGASLLPMSLGVIAWDTLPYAFGELWVFVVVAAAMAGLGYSRGISALMVAGAFCFTAFCVIMLVSYSIPGSLEGITLVMPDGRAFLIAIAP